MIALGNRRRGLNRDQRCRLGRPGGKSPRMLHFEVLEGRALLATLDLVASVIPAPLSYVANAGVTNHLTISVATIGTARQYTFKDTGDAITLGLAAKAAGWVAVDSQTVTGPSASVSAMTIDTNDGPDTVNIDATDAPITIDPTSGGAETVTIGNGSTRAIDGAITVRNRTGLTDMRVDDSGDPMSQTATLAAVRLNPTGDLLGSLSGLAPSTIGFNALELSALTIDTGKVASSLTVDFTNGVPFPLGSPGLHVGGTAANLVTLLGDAGFASERVVAAGPTATTIDLDTAQITLSNSAGTRDLVPVPSLTYVAAAAVADRSGSATASSSGRRRRPAHGRPGRGWYVDVLRCQQGRRDDCQPERFDRDDRFHRRRHWYEGAQRGGRVGQYGQLDHPAGGGRRRNHVGRRHQYGERLRGGCRECVGHYGRWWQRPTTLVYDANTQPTNITATAIAAGPPATTVTFDHLTALRVVNSADLPLRATGRTITTDLGVPFAGVTVASFTDSDPKGTAGEFTASIDLG